MFSATGFSRASNKGHCIQDFFRCCGLARAAGLDTQQFRSCCKQR